MAPRIAIVGAGISGLSAGYQLKRAGLKPVIFERASVAGGRMSSERVEGFTIDKGAYTFPEFYRHLRGLLHDVGMEHSLVETPSTSSTFAGGKEYPIKISSPRDFLGYKLLSLRNKKDMLKLFLYARSVANALHVDRPTAKTFELETESVADYLLQDYDEEILEKIAYPIFCELFLGTPEGNSKLAFLSTLRTLTWFKIYALKEGMGSLPERLAKDLEVRLNTPVLKIIPLSDEGPYEVHMGGTSPGSLRVDAVIMAMPLPLVPGIVEGLPKELEDYCTHVLYTPSIVVALATEHRLQKTSLINNLLRTEHHVLGTLTFDHHKSPTRVPQGKGLVTALLTEQASRTLWHESQEEIRDEVLREMDTLYPHFSNKLIFSRIYRWEYGGLQLPPGQLWKREAVRKCLEDGIHHLYFAGESFPISSIEASFKTAIRAAKQIIKKMGPRDSVVHG